MSADFQPVETAPDFVANEGHDCMRWRCSMSAIWRRWSGLYCYPCAILAGWLPGPVRRKGDQLVLR